MKRGWFVVFLVLFAVAAVSGQTEHRLSVNTVPYGTVPLGSSDELFKLGFGVEETVSFIPGFLKYFGIGAGADFLLLPLKSENSVWAFAGSAGPVFRLPIGDRFAVHAKGSVGYYYCGPAGWELDSEVRGGLTAGGGAGASFRIIGPFTLGAGVSYDYYSKLYNGFNFSLTARLEFPITYTPRPKQEKKPKDITPEPLEEGTGLELRDIELLPVFPVLYKYYDGNPLGSARVKNFTETTAENIKIQFYAERYMDNPMQCGKAFSLSPGEEKTIDLYGLFTDEVLSITEGTKASVKIIASYSLDGEDQTEEYNPVLEFYNRNALTWDDDRKIASFVTAKDPEILGLAKNVMSWMKQVENPAVDENLQKGMAVFEALKLYGIQYEIDPTTPFSELSEQETAIDFLQFPRQTMQYTNGDCDDLSVLYTSLLEAVGVETAVITIPGHIFAALALKSTPEEARKTFSRPDDLIFREEKAWVPVEITMFQEPFEKAWKTGAKEWRENNSRELAALYPTRDSWNVYQPVGFIEGGSGLKLPDREKVTAAIRGCITRHVEKEIYPRVSMIRGKMAESQNNPRWTNKLAVLYARYGLYDKALEYFNEVTAKREYVPSLINTGNIYFIRNEYAKALPFYERALDRNKRSATALLGLARCHHELENYGFVSSTYKQLQEADPNLAGRFAYLDLKGEEATRAADAAGIRETVVWEEEEE